MRLVAYAQCAEFGLTCSVIISYIVRVHVKRALGRSIKFEFDDDKGIKVSKEIIEEALERDLEMVSNHVDYAEAAIKFIKQRARVKNQHPTMRDFML